MTLIHNLDRSKDKMLGPVPGVGGLKLLAPMLRDAIGNYPTVADAEQYLTVLHFRNMTLKRNSYGIDYPKRVGEKNDI